MCKNEIHYLLWKHLFSSFYVLGKINIFSVFLIINVYRIEHNYEKFIIKAFIQTRSTKS